MSYRDDVDSLYQRATILQRELDAAREELSRLKGRREDTSPGMRALTDLPDPEVVLDRLVERNPQAGGAALAPIAMPDWEHIAKQPFSLPASPNAHLEWIRDKVSLLSAEDLLLISKLVEELTDTQEHMDAQLRARLRWLASELALEGR